MSTPIIPQIPEVLDLAATGVFALSGALLAARLRQTFVTMSFFALITGVGGGTVRDLLIGAPVFWAHDRWIAPVCLGVALLAWFTPRKWWEGELLEWADALGLAFYTVLGSAKALAFGIAPVPAVLMGVITGSAGGIIRDVIAGRPSIIMRPELYVTAAALSSGLCVLGQSLHLPRELVWSGAALAGFVLRGMAISRGLALPAYRGGD
ncbi:MAG: trimeric intracellular cation channel family protein [Novosphingobium sp.]